MSKPLLKSVPARATAGNISLILHSMDVYDRRADKAHTRGDFNLAMRYANFVADLDALVAMYKGRLPEAY